MGGSISHTSRSPVWWGECGREKGGCLHTEKSLGRGGSSKAAPESGHVAGNGAQGVEQGGLHTGLQEQQVHMDLGNRRYK